MKVGISTFNARSDSIDTKPAFRQSWRTGRRCLVVDGYYEWRKMEKQPFAIALGNRGPMILAGLWDLWKGPVGAGIRSASVITTGANERLAQIHDRMPVLLDPDQWAMWLGELNSTNDELKAILKPYPTERLAFWSVDKCVGNVRNDQRDLADPITLLI
jgi:putative SOS response-associated peptidase YedK